MGGNGEKNDTKEGIESLFDYLRENKACYHKRCLDNHNERAVTRAKNNKNEKLSVNKADSDLASPPCKHRSQVKKIAWCFCGQQDVSENLAACISIKKLQNF